MVLQAAGARRILGADTPQVETALANIETTGRQAMSELRRLLGLLSANSVAPGHQPDEREPPPGLADLQAVIGRVAAAGLRIESRERGTPRPLDVSIGLAVHRVVTEALTNALKHAGSGAAAEVVLDWGPNLLTVTVTDDGGGQPAPGSVTLSGGLGLVGLGERVRAVGGSLAAGPTATGGYRVSATLPSPSRAATAPSPARAADAESGAGEREGSP
jgi:signal transduction histidine kinase